MENSAAPQPSVEDLLRRVLETIGTSMAASATRIPPVATSIPIGAIPEFSGADIGDDADIWCNRVENLTKEVPYQRLSLATHALVGPAKKWYQGWKANPCTWEKFREDLCAIFVSERKLHDRLLRALQYTSESATSYAEYARTKLTYLQQTEVAFTIAQEIELIISTISDPIVRQAMLSAKYASTSDLQVGIAEHVRVKKDVIRTRDGETQKLLGKRCYSCNETGHISRFCAKRVRVDRRHNSPMHDSSRHRSPPRGLPRSSAPKHIATCSYCSKRGHEASNCWIKQRADRDKETRKNVGAGKPQASICFSVNHKLSPVYIKDSLVQGSLIDSGATCSLIKERVARRSNCKIEPYVTSISGLSGSTTTVGSTTEVITTEELSVELDFFVVPDDSIPYDLIIGKNVLVGGGIRIVTTPDGITKLERVPDAEDDAGREADPLCLAIDGVDDETRDALADLLLKYKHMVATGNIERRVSTGELAIRVKEDRVVSYHPYRLSISEREKVRKIITELLANEVIRESTSPYASPIIIVKKKNGEDRLCVDYRALNKITVKDRYPLPLIEDQLDRLGTRRYFTTLDMASGFYQIPIAEGSIDKTAFITPDGHYEFLRMPFGLANAPAVFQRAINTALGNLRNNIALVYLDDILIPSETIEQGFERLEQVLKALDVAGFTLNLKKCAFFKTKLEYLGREISSEGVRPGMSKVNSLLQAPVPENVKQVRQFMGLASYFRKFIPEFAVRTACVTKLTKKDAPWQWGADQEEARKYILGKLSSKPLLIIFDPKRETELHTDASSLGYGAILFQRVEGSLRVVAYFSRRTTPEESRYHSYELETLAIVNALKCFRVYLLGIRFKIVTDCNAIKATSSKRNLIPRIARWWVFLQDYTFEIEYRKGKQVEHVDYLSRNPRKDYRVDFVCEGSWLEIAQKNDEETKDIINKINSDHTVSSDFEYKQGILCRKVRRDTGRIVYRSFVPKGSRLGLLHFYHDENCHVRFDKTFDRISQKFWFPKMRAFLKKYLDHIYFRFHII